MTRTLIIRMSHDDEVANLKSVPGFWSLVVPDNPVPRYLLSRSLHPIVRRICSFATLSRCKDGTRNQVRSDGEK